MGMFNPYRSKVACEKTDSELALCEITREVIDDFLLQPNHETIYKNFTPEVNYDVIIHSGDSKNNTVSYKQLLSYPYSTPQFSIGDYIHWNYGGFGQENPSETIWLLLACDKHYRFSVGGRIYECKQVLKFKDSNGVLQEYPSYTEDKLNETQPDFDKAIHLPEGTIFSYVKYDDNTKNIRENRRFLIGNRGEYVAYKVHGVKNFSDENLVRFTMYQDQIDNVRDDLVNGVANAYSPTYELEIDATDFEQSVGYTGILDASLKLNGEVVVKPLTWTSSDESVGVIDQNGEIELLSLGNVVFKCEMADNEDVYDEVIVDVVVAPIGVKEVRFEPSIDVILSSDGYVEYTIQKYLDNEVQIDGFSFSLSGANQESYMYEYVDANTIKISSLEYDYNKLLIEATSLVDGTVGTLEIQLKNLF